MELTEAIAHAYDAFTCPPPGGGRDQRQRCEWSRDTLDVCTGCCVDPQVADELVRMPLRQLTADHFYAYNSSARSVPQPPQELAYFLPRLLELIVEGAEVHHSVELYLARLGSTDPTWFTAEQRQAVADVAEAHIAALLGSRDEPGTRRGEDLLAWLLMWHLGGVDVVPLLDHWLRDERAEAVLHYAKAVRSCRGRGYDNPFSTAEFTGLVESWLSDPANRIVFAGRIAALAGRGGWPGEIDDLLTGAFDVVTWEAQ